MATYSIHDLETISGIKAHTIRIWEKRYGTTKPERTPTNIRYYNDYDLRRLLNIAILKRNNFKISKIANLSNDEVCEKVLLLSQNDFFPENIIESLTLSMLEFDENKFDHLLSNQILRLGFEETFISVLQPFFERVGVLWQAGSIKPVHEHFISNLVRQKLMVAIESQHSQPIPNKKISFVLFLPEGEWHELGLLFYQYLLKKHGIKSLYFGQSVPLRDLVKIIPDHSFDYALTCFTTSMSSLVVNNWITQLSSVFSATKVFISGPVIKKYEQPLPKNIVKISNNQFVKWLSETENSL